MKFLLIFFSLIFILWSLSLIYKSSKSNLTPSPSPFPASSIKGVSLSYKDQNYTLYLQKIDQPEKLTLIPNFSEKKSSAEIMKENKCAYGVNGGFYTKDDKPLGLFYANGKLQSPTKPSTLFNGFVYQTTDGSIKVDKDAPSVDLLNFVFQSGPFITPGRYLSIVNDEKARRVLVGQNAAGQFYFLAAVEKDNVNSGPYLADLPDILKQFNSSASLRTGNESAQRFILLLNLDGGAASAFYSTDGIAFGELTPIGSFLCSQES